MQQNSCVMPTNFTLRDCNIADICCLDGEVLHPQTNTDQVLLSNGTTLTSWMGGIPSGGSTPSLSITNYFDSGIKIADINYDNVNYPFNVPIYDGENHTDAGLVKLDTDNFNFDNGVWKSKLSFTHNSGISWSSIKYLDLTGSNISALYFPTFGLSNSTSSDLSDSYLDINLVVGGANGITASTSIPSSRIASIVNNGILDNLVAGDNISISQNNNQYTIRAVNVSYQAGSGLNIDSTTNPKTIKHSNILTSSGSFNVIGVNTSVTPNTYNLFTINHDINGHITSKNTGSEITFDSANDSTITLRTQSSIYNDDFSPLGTNNNHNIMTDIFGSFTLNQDSDNDIYLPYPKIDYENNSGTIVNKGQRNLPGVIRTLIQYGKECVGNINLQAAEFRGDRVVSLEKPDYVDYRGRDYGRYYPVESDCNGVAFVHVPWTVTGVSAATSSRAGIIKLGSDTEQSDPVNPATSDPGRTYPVQLNSSGQAVVNVPAGSGSSVSALNDLSDVTLSTPSNSQILTYNSTNSKWVNANFPNTVVNVIDSVRMSGDRQDIEINNKRVIIPSYVLVTTQQAQDLITAGVDPNVFIRTRSEIGNYYLVDYQYLLPRA